MPSSETPASSQPVIKRTRVGVSAMDGSCPAEGRADGKTQGCLHRPHQSGPTPADRAVFWISGAGEQDPALHRSVAQRQCAHERKMPSYCIHVWRLIWQV